MSGGSFTTTSPSQAWAILSRHARDDISGLRLKELCSDNDRVSSLVTVHSGSESATKRRTASILNSTTNGKGHSRSNSSSVDNVINSNLDHYNNRLLIADMSRQRMTLETLNYLLRLAAAVDVRGFILTLAWGHNDRKNPFYTSIHSEHNKSKGKETVVNRNKNNAKVNNSQFSFDQDEHLLRSNVTMSPSRSVTSAMKKTRFAQPQPGDPSDDQTVSSNIQTPSSAAAAAASQYKLSLNTSPSMYMALRAPNHCNLHMYDSNGENVLNEIHSQHDRVKMLADSIRNGQLRGMNGHMLQNVLVIGRGTACAACEFVYNALKHDLQGRSALKRGISDRKLSMRYGTGRSMRFLSRLDPLALHKALEDWNPEQTLVISIVLNGDENDIMYLTNVVKQWLCQGMNSSKRQDTLFGRHVFFITASDVLFQSQTVTKPECCFLIPSYARSEAFTSLSVAGLLPLSIAFGWDIVQDLLFGAHDMDSHFVETNPRHNLPVLLALVDLWNDHFLSSFARMKPLGGRIITPFMESFASYPKFIATLESQLIGRVPQGLTRNHNSKVAPSGMVIDGGMCGTYDRVLYQGGRSPPSELIHAIEPQVAPIQDKTDDYMKMLFGAKIDGEEEELSMQDYNMCSFFAHADFMATGNMNFLIRDGNTVTSGYTATPMFGNGGIGASASFDQSNNNNALPILNAENEVAVGNHPSTLLLCSKCDAFACGQLIALAEHRAIISARLWDIENPFAFVSNHGSTVRNKQEDAMKEKLESMYQRLDLVGDLEAEDEACNGDGPKLNLAIKTLLGHYATRMHHQRKQI
jgi:glucose-6-phosphate isomerase